MTRSHRRLPTNLQRAVDFVFQCRCRSSQPHLLEDPKPACRSLSRVFFAAARMPLISRPALCLQVTNWSVPRAVTAQRSVGKKVWWRPKPQRFTGNGAALWLLIGHWTAITRLTGARVPAPRDALNITHRTAKFLVQSLSRWVFNSPRRRHLSDFAPTTDAAGSAAAQMGGQAIQAAVPPLLVTLTECCVGDAFVGDNNFRNSGGAGLEVNGHALRRVALGF